MDALRVLELDELEELESEEKERFEVYDLASWVFRKLHAMALKSKEIDSVAEAEMERIREWQATEKKRNEANKEYLESLVVRYFTEERAKDEKFKLSTPWGKVSARKSPPSYVYDDEKLLNFLKSSDRGEFIRVSESVDKALLKKSVTVQGDVVVDENGEIIDGITIVEKGLSVSVKVEEV